VRHIKLVIKEVVVESHIDVRKFLRYFRLYMNLTDAIDASLEITKNNTELNDEDIANLIIAETNWGIVFNVLDQKKMIKFRICDAEYFDKITYIRGETNSTFTNVRLNKTENEDGETWVVINDIIGEPEHYIDNWLSNNIYDNLNSEWERIIIDWNK